MNRQKRRPASNREVHGHGLVLRPGSCWRWLRCARRQPASQEIIHAITTLDTVRGTPEALAFADPVLPTGQTAKIRIKTLTGCERTTWDVRWQIYERFMTN
jgi:hypothetical protein